MKYHRTSIVTVCIRIACLFSTVLRRAIRGIKTLPSICTDALQRPSVQYRMALVFATILAFLLGWPLFLSTLSHAPSAFIGHL